MEWSDDIKIIEVHQAGGSKELGHPKSHRQKGVILPFMLTNRCKTHTHTQSDRIKNPNRLKEVKEG